MKQGKIVYLDILFGTELLMNYLVLKIYCAFTRKTIEGKRILLAVGTVSIMGTAVMILADCQNGWSLWHSFFFVIIMAIIEMWIIQFPIKGKRKRNVILEVPGLILSAGLLAGIFMATQKNQTHLPTLVLYAGSSICAMACMGGITIMNWRSTGIAQDTLKQVGITLGEKTYTVTAITDTGNNLYDKLSGQPVHIIEQSCILNEEQKEYFFREEPDRITWIPFASLGNSNGILQVMRVDEIVIQDGKEKKILKNQKVGLADQKLSKSGEWQMLLHPDLEACVNKK